MTVSCSPTPPTMAAMTARIVPRALLADKSVQGPLRRLRAAEERLAAAQAARDEIRRQTVLDLVDQGLSYQQIAELLGVTKSRAFQLARGQ